jgi:metal-dependent amidase/aminoacylase/carboxypeptidase family protein
VVADLVELSGTLRSLGGDHRERLLQSMQRVAGGTSGATGCSVRLNVSDSFPAVVNDPELYERALEILLETLGSDRVRVLTEVPMTADDFAHYLEAVPALYIKLGCAPAEGRVYPLHHRCFDIDERVIWTGVEAISSILLDTMDARVAEEMRA